MAGDWELERAVIGLRHWDCQPEVTLHARIIVRFSCGSMQDSVRMTEHIVEKQASATGISHGCPEQTGTQGHSR